MKRHAGGLSMASYGLPDLGLAGFKSDEWRFSAVCVVVVGVVVVPSYLLYRSSRAKHEGKYQVALLEAEAKLERARNRGGGGSKRNADTVH